MSVNRLAGWGSAVVVIAALTWAMWLAGSPGASRLERLDEMRVSHLRSLAEAVNGHWLTTGELPVAMGDLVDGLRLSQLPADPATGAPYDYLVIDSGRYRLCANFAATSQDDDAGDFWAHGPGRRCYEFEAGDSQ